MNIISIFNSFVNFYLIERKQMFKTVICINQLSVMQGYIITSAVREIMGKYSVSDSADSC